MVQLSKRLCLTVCFLFLSAFCRLLFFCIPMGHSHNKVDNAEWRFLISGYTTAALEDSEDTTNPAPSWLTEKSWTEMLALSALKSMAGLSAHVSGWWGWEFVVVVLGCCCGGMFVVVESC